MDPELAMALRVSMEEERARQEAASKATAEQEGAPAAAAAEGDAAAAASAEGGEGAAAAAAAGGAKEEAKGAEGGDKAAADAMQVREQIGGWSQNRWELLLLSLCLSWFLTSSAGVPPFSLLA